MTDERLFHEALARPARERDEFLEWACAGRPDTRAAVAALLAAHEAPASLLDRSPAGAPTLPLFAGAVVAGRYTLVEMIGEGGMGEVWVAKQTEPVKRKVALKLIKAGMGSKTVLGRFEQERQALALMDHPNIAKVFDGGLTDDGRPFFVMELVNGLALTRFCDEARLTPRERLELFVPVCQAVQHAHQKGVIHRDLKPSNILVTLIDGTPVPKIIDFGVAKATGGRLTDESLSTQFGTVVGTLEYMSPEQTAFSGRDVDTRSDVYSLGVILYELLTGLRPFDAERLRAAAPAETIRIIVEEEPSKPSTRLSTNEALPAAAAVRQTEPSRLMAMLRGELDCVVMKCLEKQRDRRYETADGLARDVRRYLANEPVEARPPSSVYRMRKFVRRHKGQVVAAGLLLLALLGGIAGTTWGMLREAERAEGEQVARRAALDAAGAAAAAEAAAQKRLRQIERGSAILMSVFTDLDPREAEKTDRPLQAVLGDRLTQAAEQLEGEAVGDPLLVAELQNRLGLSLLRLDQADRAIPLFVKARTTRAALLGGDHPDTLFSMNDLATGYQAVGQFDRAVALFEETLEARKAKLGTDHGDTFLSMSNLAAAYRAAGKPNQALELFEKVLRRQIAVLGADHRYTLLGMGNLAAAYQAAGQPDRALPLMAEATRLMKEKLGADHLDTLQSMSNLAVALQSAGKLNQAVPLFEETLELRRAKLGPDHRDTLLSMGKLAIAYRATRRLDRALPLYEEAYRGMKAKLGPEHPSTLDCLGNLAFAYRDAGKLDQALPLLEESFRLRKAKLGPDHSSTLIAMNNLAMAYQDAHRLNDALPLYEETLKARRAVLGPNHPDTVLSANNLGWAYRATGKVDKALPLFLEAAEGLERLRFQHQHAGRIINNLVECQESAEGGRRLEQAEAWRRKWLAAGKDRYGAESPGYAVLLAALGQNLLQQKKWADAEAPLRACLTIREAKAPTDWRTFYTRSLIGTALLGQKKYAEAEPLFLESYEGLKKLGDKSGAECTARRREAAGQLVQLYEAMERADDAAKWKREFDTTTPSAKP
jgi:hypothetical protein